jgi:hypothetical protein
MKRLYLIGLEYGNGIYRKKYNIVAASDEEAVRKAKRQARKDSGRKLKWRTVELSEQSEQLVA